MTAETRPIEIRHGDAVLEAMLVGAGGDPRPAVLIFPTIMGRSDLELGFAERLVGLGYAALVADPYGREHVGKPREECRALMIAADKCRVEIGKHILHSGILHGDEINNVNGFGDTALAIARGTDSDKRAKGVESPRCAELVPELQSFGAR